MQDRLDEIEARLRRVEDQLEIQTALMGHPPGADTASHEALESLYTEDAVMSVGEQDPERHGGDMEGDIDLEQVKSVVTSSEFQDLIGSGLAHISTAPIVSVGDDDTATAWNYTALMGNEGRSFRVRRVIANRWELRRDGGHWKVFKRTYRLLDGNPEAVAILAGAVSGAYGGE